MKSLNPYLIFEGNAEEAFNFYQSVLGGKIAFLMRIKDGPEGDKITTEDGEKIMHICLPFSKDQMLMASDMTKSMCGGEDLTFQQGNSSFISLTADNETEARLIFNKLSDGGQIFVPINKMFWGDIFGQFMDRFGVQWMVSAQTSQSE